LTGSANAALGAIVEYPLDITPAVQYGNDLERFRQRPIDNKVGIGSKESDVSFRQIPPQVSDTRRIANQLDLCSNLGNDPIRNFGAALTFNVVPNAD
jgi:hypothetical protein